MSDKDPADLVNLTAKSPFELRTGLGRDIPEPELHTALAVGNMGFLHSFTTGSTVDGPGVRLVAWLSGCQFRCLYCHNPDTWNMNYGIPVTLGAAMEELRKYSGGLKIMSGGLTLSGGEPLMQDRFVMRLITAARTMGIHTALDTNGSLGKRISDGELEAIDLVLLDIKCWGAERHRALTGMDIQPVLDFARRLSNHKRPVWVRFVLVPGLTDDSDDIAQIAKFAASLGNVEKADVLPFHQMGQFKWKALKLDYTLADVRPPPAAVVQRVVDQFRAEGLKAY